MRALVEQLVEGKLNQSDRYISVLGHAAMCGVCIEIVLDRAPQLILPNELMCRQSLAMGIPPAEIYRRHIENIQSMLLRSRQQGIPFRQVLEQAVAGRTRGSKKPRLMN